MRVPSHESPAAGPLTHRRQKTKPNGYTGGVRVVAYRATGTAGEVKRVRLSLLLDAVARQQLKTCLALRT